MSIKELQEYIRITKYARYNKEKGRRETWEEQINRVFNMHYKHLGEDKIESLKEELQLAKKYMLEKKIVGSQRNLQFGGDPVLKNNEKAYNCAAMYIDRPRAFQESLYLLINGTGVGYHVGKFHINKLPDINKRSNEKIEYVIPDTIEGWADSIGVLMSSYFRNSGLFDNIYENKTIIFNFDKIRPEGSRISWGGKAPGPKPLKNAINKIESVIENCFNLGLNRLRPIDAYDILMHIADAAISGGSRRSACITLFDIDDELMASSKTGDWNITNKQRARSNNSIVMNRNTVDKEQYLKVMENVKEFSEPGNIFTDNEIETLYNPCQPYSALVLSENGLIKFGELKEGDRIWSETGWTTVLKKWKTGCKKTYKFKTSGGCFYGTDNHRIVSDKMKIEVKDAKHIDVLNGPYYNTKIVHDAQIVMDGLMLGDGTRDGHKGYRRTHLCISKKDQDYFSSEISNLIIKSKDNKRFNEYSVTSNISFDELPKTYERTIPDRYFYSDYNTICSFLRGLYSANGSVTNNTISFKTTSSLLKDQIITMLSSIGIKAYYSKYKEYDRTFYNGTYHCRESYNITFLSDVDKFYNNIGFLQQYKMDKLKNIVDKKLVKKPKKSSNIIDIEYIGEEDVYDITVDNEPHTYWTNGLNVSNCCEVSLRGYDEHGNSGIQFCNLSEINAKKCKTEEDFYEACKASSIIGTIQASYTNFPYLGEVTERITRREALIGVSITGIMDNPDIALNPEILKKGAEIVKETNKEIASKLGINQAARCCVGKPSGNTSALLGVSSGVHYHHSKRYFRRVQANKNESPLQFFKLFNDLAVEESVWSANKNDDVITFTCDVPPNIRVKNNVSALEMLKTVKLVQMNWVNNGKNTECCVRPWLNHNISNTVHVLENEWDDVFDFIFENREYFSGVSLTAASSDKDYYQAPFQAVYDPKELVEMYGDAAMFASGLIVHAQQAFDGNLYAACDCFLGIGEKLDIPNLQGDALVASIDKLKKILDKSTWIERAKKFTKNYFNGDKKKMTYALKDCDSWKKWVDLKREYSNVPWEKFFEDQDNTKVEESAACGGGKCEIL